MFLKVGIAYEKGTPNEILTYAKEPRTQLFLISLLWMKMNRDEIQDESINIPFEVLGEIKRKMDEFTPRQRVFAEFVLQKPESMAFLSITDLAREAGVSQATIVRFCNVLGFDGFTQLSRMARATIHATLNSAGRFRLVRRLRERSIKKDFPHVFERVISQEIENLINLPKSIKTADFYRCVDMMANADRICIIGCLASNSLATYFGQMLSKILSQVDVIHGHGIMSSAICKRLTSKSLVFLISFPRYPKETVELGRFAAEKGAQIVTITDSHVAPVVQLSSLSFNVQIGIPSFVDAYAAPIAFINALVTELSERCVEKTQMNLGHYDDYTSQMDLFAKSAVDGGWWKKWP